MIWLARGDGRDDVVLGVGVRVAAVPTVRTPRADLRGANVDEVRAAVGITVAVSLALGLSGTQVDLVRVGRAGDVTHAAWRWRWRVHHNTADVDITDRGRHVAVGPHAAEVGVVEVSIEELEVER